MYGRGVALRNYLYEKGIFEVHDLGARTISVGNITVGGTGKTPLVAYIAAELADRGEKVCILTRGYGREDESKRVLVSDGESVLADAVTGGDEPVELAHKLLGKAIVIADADRVGAAEWAKRKFGVTAFVLDDGFQHRKIKRDIDLVCVDATDPFGGGNLVPAGRLREPTPNLARASVVVITRVEQVGDISDLRSQISDLAPRTKIVESRSSLSEIKTLTKGSEVRGRAFAFCGLGNPQSFFTLLAETHLEICGTHALRDHQTYRQSDIDAIEKLARSAGAEALITTGKDAVKLAKLRSSLPVFVPDLIIQLSEPLHL
jgi:tetraacyldisaccharide 4'-kinase